MSEEFTTEQKSYLEGFAAGSNVTGLLQQSLPTWAGTVGAAAGKKPHGDDGPSRDPNLIAQDRHLAEGKKLCAEENAKRKLGHGLDIWDEMVRHAQDAKYPKGTDVFLFKFQGMFYVAPAQDSFMCRLRIPGGVMTAAQLKGVANLAEQYGGGYADVTTRANLQIRQITAPHTVDVLMGLHDVGIVNRGSGADNIRNITCSPLAGIDPQELIDTLPLARKLHHFILNHREMYGLPRKFNIAFDGGGQISALEDTNDIGFTAVKVKDTGEIVFRLTLGGITGHKDFARDTGVVVRPADCIKVSEAIVKAFIEHGDRTDRKKARLKYVLDRMGFDGFIAECEKHYGKTFDRLPLEQCETRPVIAKRAHIGVHEQKQPGLRYVGVVLPVGRMTCDQMRGIAKIADRYGSGTIRLTVWQNLLISDIPGEAIAAVKNELVELGLHWLATSIRGGIVACTGSAGCKFAAANTKKHALEIVNHVEKRVPSDAPVNIHVTGCAHSCAQHYIGDIGLIATKVGEESEEGYHVFVGGGYGTEQGIGRELVRDVLATDAPHVVERIMLAYHANRQDDESFRDFTVRYPTEALKQLIEAVEVPA